jgi:nucleoside-diphosphate-sugar epimerase
MDVVVAGGHGQIGLRLLRALAAGGHRGRGIIRNADHAPELEAAGARAVVLDLEHEEIGADALAGADAVVFAAGAGPGSGPERKRTMDLGGAVKLIEVARAAGVERYVIVSAIGAADPPAGDEGMAVYLQAKAEADEALADSGLAYTIVRPGRLTDDPPTGRVTAGARVARGDITRQDVADLLLAVLKTPSTVGATFNVVNGDTPIDDAVAAL